MDPTKEYAVKRDESGAVSITRQTPPQSHEKKKSNYRLPTFIVLSLLLFLTISSTLQFKDSLFNTLFPKPPSRALEPSGSQTVSKETKFLSNELLIKFKKGVRGTIKEGNPQDTGLNSINQILKNNAVTTFTKVVKEGKNSNRIAEIFGWYKIILPINRAEIIGNFDKKTGNLLSQDTSIATLQKLIDDLRNDQNIQVVEPNFIVNTQAVPSDPYYSSTGSWNQSFADMWGMKRINPELAWDQITDTSSIVVADIDSGIDINHEDLRDNMWVNIGEIQDNGVDDDGNGYIDDYYGWDFVNGDGVPMDDNGHGTHTAGTIMAAGNNAIGVVGVAWKGKIMAVKFLSAQGSALTGLGVNALIYAADMGAKISSNSWGGVQNDIINDAVMYEHEKGMVIVASAGNSSADALDHSPASSDRAITVSASDTTDVLAVFSNKGEKIDVAAPGVNILSLRASGTDIYGDGKHFVPDGDINSKYYRASGTSMAAPHVAGLAALIWSKNPSFTNEQIRQMLRSTATDLGTSGKDVDFGYGLINAGNAVSNANSSPLAPIITSPASRTLISGTAFQITGTAAGSNFVSYKIEQGIGRTPTSWTTIASSNTPVNNGVLATVDTTKLAEGKGIFRLTATDISGKSYQFQVHDVEVDNIQTAITSPAAASTVFGIATVSASLSNLSQEPVDKVEFYIRDRLYLLCGIPTYPPCPPDELIGTDYGPPYSINWDTTSISHNSYDLIAKAINTIRGVIDVSPSIIISVNNIDHTPPIVSFVQPKEAETIKGTYTVIATASDERLVNSLSISMDGNAYLKIVTGTSQTLSLSYSLNTTLYSNGTHILQARATDEYDESFTEIRVTIDNITPTPTRTPTPTLTPTPTPLPDTTPPTVSITAPTATYVKGTTTVSATATDNSGGSGIAGVQFLLDGVNLSVEDTTSPYSISWNTSTTTNGLHILKAIARDKAGNKTTSPGKSVIVDNTPPTVSVTAPLTARKGTTITISASATDSVAMSSLSLSYNGQTQCSSSTSPYSCSKSITIPSTTATGNYSGSAKATDKAGNSTTKNFSVYVY